MTRVLRRGDKGQCVLELQRALQGDWLELADDGDFGPDTEAAVEDFQRRKGLEVDGLVGPDTLAALGLDPEVPEATDEALGAGDDIIFDPEQVTALPEQPLAVEVPGGGRITDKREPSPEDVVTVEGLGGKKVKLHSVAATYWFRLITAGRSDGLAEPALLPVSGLRTIARQEELWRNALEKYGSEQEASRWVARPGGSAHHSGRAVDCWLGTPVGREHVDDQRETSAWAWLVDNAERFGFYPYEVEPWHWEYNPPHSG